MYETAQDSHDNDKIKQIQEWIIPLTGFLELLKILTSSLQKNGMQNQAEAPTSTCMTSKLIKVKK